MPTVLNLTTAQRNSIHRWIDRLIGVVDVPSDAERGIPDALRSAWHFDQRHDLRDPAGTRAVGARLQPDPLDRLEGRWAGEGFSVTSLPAASPTVAKPFELQINATKESLNFWPVADRAAMDDRQDEQGTLEQARNPHFLALNYVHEISDKASPPKALNHETGMWSSIPARTGGKAANRPKSHAPAAKPVDFDATVVQMATIPGYSVLAMGPAAEARNGIPAIPVVAPLPPARIDGNVRSYIARTVLPAGIPAQAAGDPNLFLRQLLEKLTREGMGVVDAIELNMSTADRTVQRIGAGQVANLPVAAGSAIVSAVDTRYWIVTMEAAGGRGTFLLLLYSRLVTLDFDGVEYRHIATGWLRRQ